ncbi:MAG: sulfatase-like hydrolase/transferase, partial [Bacteroidales bacterium]|nr:sulfatase-like hydrolase/transferase [Bacteroidales bacterium]
MKKNFLALTALIFMFSALFLSCNSGKETKSQETNEKPNIVFFIADYILQIHFNTLQKWERQNLTPNMDRLAREGVVMLNQTVVSPVCTPSRYNCLTGRFASRASNPEFLKKTKNEEGMTCIQWNSFLTSEDKIISHYLQEAGYKTGFVGKNHAIDASGFKMPKDYFADPEDPEIKEMVTHNYNQARDAILGMGFDYAEAVYHNNPRWLGLKGLAVQNMDWIAEAGVNFISQQDEDPFFLYFATTLPHAPTNPANSWNADPRITAKGIIDEAPDVLPARETLGTRVKEAGLEGKGRENILWLDDALGALINELEAKGKLDNTIIFFFSDHGQNAKGTVYQGGVLDPSIIWKSGGFKCGPTSEQTVSNVDFAPTILELAGVKVESSAFDGRSFKAALDGEKMDEPGTQYYELGYARAVRKGNYKYIAVRYPDYATNWT